MTNCNTASTSKSLVERALLTVASVLKIRQECPAFAHTSHPSTDCSSEIPAAQ